MKILFDLEATQPSGSGKRHGGGIYGEMVLRKLIEKGAELVVFYNSTKWLNPEIRKDVEASNAILIDTQERPLEQIVEEFHPDILYSPLPQPSHISLDIKRKVGTVHGLRTLEWPHDKFLRRYSNESYRSKIKFFLESIFPNYFRNKIRKRISEIIGMDIVTVSNHSAFSLKTFFPEIEDRKIPVFYSPSTTVEMDIPTEHAANYPYFLMVSGNRWEKNTLRAIMAFERLFDDGFLDGFKVHITGLKKLSDIKYNFRHRDRFLALGYVDDDELQRQYRDAYGFIYPSLNEGFGYPPLEAMRFGVPVAASAVCSIPEVCGDAVLYFNPMDIPEIANRIIQLTDPEIRKYLKGTGLKRYDFITAKQNSDLNKLADYIMKS